MPRPALRKRRSQQPLAKPRSKRRDWIGPLRGLLIFRRDWCPRVGLGPEADMTRAPRTARVGADLFLVRWPTRHHSRPFFAAALCQAIKAFPAVLALTLNWSPRASPSAIQTCFAI